MAAILFAKTSAAARFPAMTKAFAASTGLSKLSARLTVAATQEKSMARPGKPSECLMSMSKSFPAYRTRPGRMVEPPPFASALGTFAKDDAVHLVRIAISSDNHADAVGILAVKTAGAFRLDISDALARQFGLQGSARC